ncbi:uncharacterized protein J8A68_005290 [[Candida] subhashii]|uniref:C2H2-type domain-containing protein n=1 Tax=[Candida] subhashii TaxID=561895 RepID=A0A8J5QH79_9ASCO|nr:uncharacterized protein J8A68_005290 [[Candida] subhashii]KAG7661196.1 hypothetical protein J8A68_005290 [[Candida] subhashii]
MDHQESLDQSEIKKKRKRTYGTFICDHPDCNRVFTRADHLSRHKKNHDPSRQLICSWPGCQQVFARNDIREKHYQRHITKVKKLNDKLPLRNINSTVLSSSKSVSTSASISTNTSRPGLDNTQDMLTMPLSATSSTPSITASPISLPLSSSSLTMPTATTTMAHVQPSLSSSISMSNNNSIASSTIMPPSVGSMVPSSSFMAPSLSMPTHLNLKPMSPSMSTPNPTKPLNPSDLIDWLFQDDTMSKGKLATSEFYNFPTDVPVSSLFMNAFVNSPSFPMNNSKNRTSIDHNIREKLINLLPELNANPDFGIPQIERCLELYWSVYHTQYPILHKPSFSNQDAHPLLLLAMIMVGASFTDCTSDPQDPNGTLFMDPQKLAEQIADPLRWLIFSNSECRPPAKTYIIQSLLLLESFEITSTTRYLHERSFLYHGTKIQLLRRSPLLGGDPLKKEVAGPPQAGWKQWIEYESMKRACFMAFYLDTVNATVYGHTLILYAYQIQLSLPCEDYLWEYDNIHQKHLITPTSFQPPKFLDALKKLLHRQPVHTTKFGRSLLLAGLLTIMFQMQQRDLQLSFLEWNSTKQSWNETMSLAMDVWRTEICGQGGCCSTEMAINPTHDPTLGQQQQQILIPSLSPQDTGCKFSLYHIAQIYMRITHYDYIVYAGAPSRMNVAVTENEYATVQKRVNDWARSLNGGIATVHAYLILCEMLLSPENDEIVFGYNMNADPFLHRRNIIISAILVVFAYNFSQDGPEADIFDQLAADGGTYPEREDGHGYLKRIRAELSRSSAGNFHLHSNNNNVDPVTFHNNIKTYAEYLRMIRNKNNMVGLLKLLYNAYCGSKWEIGLEYSNLLRNCIERCLGRNNITCNNMYLRP